MRRVLLLLLVLAICSLPAWARATKDQREKVKETFDLYPAAITVPEKMSELAWERTAEWISLVPDHRVEESTKYVIKTYRPYKSDSMDLTCSAKRRPVPDGSSITANCHIDNPFALGEKRRSTAMLRRYIMTGEEACLASGMRVLEAAACLLECDEDGGQCQPRPADQSFPDDIVAMEAEEEAVLVGNCTLDQIITMAQSGLAKEQIKAACDNSR